VVAASQKQDAVIQLTLAGKTAPDQAARQFLAQEGVQAGQTSGASINGHPAATSYFQAQTQQGMLRGIVSFIAFGGTTYGMLAFTPADRFSGYDPVFLQTIRSFTELRDSKALNIQPARVELVKLPSAMTLMRFQQQYPSTIPMEELAIINEVEGPETSMPAGRTVKRVVGGR
jgi:predicted Zn-dependent protease